MADGEGQEATEAKGLPLGAVLDFMRLLWAVDHSLQSASKRMESVFGITGPQRLGVRIVGGVPGIAAGAGWGMRPLHPRPQAGDCKGPRKGARPRRPRPT